MGQHAMHVVSQVHMGHGHIGRLQARCVFAALFAQRVMCDRQNQCLGQAAEARCEGR